MISLRGFRRLIIACILVGVIAFIAGVAAAGLGLSVGIISNSSDLSRRQVALVQATVESSSQESRSQWGSPEYVRFQNDTYGIFTATIDNAHHISNSGIYLPINTEYKVQVWYLNLTATYLNFDWHQCIPSPDKILVSGQQQQSFDFNC